MASATVRTRPRAGAFAEMSDELKAGKVVRIGEGVTLILGDCLELLAKVRSGSMDAVVTDPPYMIGAISTGNAKSKAGGWVDLMNASFWYRAWMTECWRALKDGGYMLIFLNWRTLPMLMKACADAKIETTSLAVWDKEWIGPSGPAQLRPTYEMVLFCGKGEARIDDRSQCDIFRHKWMARLSDGGHAAAKPVPLLKRLIELVTKPGEIVLDPFTGGGTTGIAAIQAGRRFEGYEGDEAHFANSAERIAQASDPMRGLSSGGELEAGTFDFAAQPASASQQPLL